MKRRQASKSNGVSVKKTSVKSRKRANKHLETSPYHGGPQLVARPSIILPAPPTPGQPDLPPPPPRRFFRSKARQVEYACTTEEIIASLEAQHAQITLGNDIIVNQNIIIDHDVAIDFNGHSIIADQTMRDLRVFDIRRGEVTLTGNGKVFAMGTNDIAVRVFGAISSGVPDYTTVTIDEDIHLYAPEGSGLLIAPNLGVAYGVTVNFRGEIIARSGICLSQAVRGIAANIPEINIKSGARIIADELFGSAIEAAGLGNWHISAAKLFGVNGINLHLGNLELSHTQIISSNAALALDAEPQSDLKVLIDGGIYISETGLTVTGDPEALEEFVIRGGDFCGALGIFEEELANVAKIQDGRFSTNVVQVLRELEPDTEWDLKISPDFLGEFHPAADAETMSTDVADSAALAEEATIVSDEIDPVEAAQVEEKILAAFAQAEAVSAAEEIYTTEYNNTKPANLPTESKISDDEDNFKIEFEEDLQKNDNRMKSARSSKRKQTSQNSAAEASIENDPALTEVIQESAELVVDLPIEALEAWMADTGDHEDTKPTLSQSEDVSLRQDSQADRQTSVNSEAAESSAPESAQVEALPAYSDEDADIITQAFVNSESLVQLPDITSLGNAVSSAPTAKASLSLETSAATPQNREASEGDRAVQAMEASKADPATPENDITTPELPLDPEMDASSLLLQPSDLKGSRPRDLNAEHATFSKIGKVALTPPPAPVMPEIPFFEPAKKSSSLTTSATQTSPTPSQIQSPQQNVVDQPRSDLSPTGALPSSLDLFQTTTAQPKMNSSQTVTSQYQSDPSQSAFSQSITDMLQSATTQSVISQPSTSMFQSATTKPVNNLFNQPTSSIVSSQPTSEFALKSTPSVTNMYIRASAPTTSFNPSPSLQWNTTTQPVPAIQSTLPTQPAPAIQSTMPAYFASAPQPTMSQQPMSEFQQTFMNGQFLEPADDEYYDPEYEERENLRDALAQALLDMRKLRADDYIDGFSEFQTAMLATEMLLSDPETCLSDIRDAASDLINALDQLEEADDSSLTDMELDQLFYHGSVLKEVASFDEDDYDYNYDRTSPAASERVYNLPQDQYSAVQNYYAPSASYYNRFSESSQTLRGQGFPAQSQSSSQPPVFYQSQTPIASQPWPQSQQIPASLSSWSQSQQVWPESQTRSDYLGQNAPQDWSAYQSQALSQPQQYNTVQSWPQSSQYTPYATAQPWAASSQYVPTYNAYNANEPTYAQPPAYYQYPYQPQSQRFQSSQTKASPINNRPAYRGSSYLIDEQTPNATWSTGATAIDCADPYRYPTPQNLSTSISGFFKGISAGFQAGFTAFRKTRHSYKV